MTENEVKKYICDFTSSRLITKMKEGEDYYNQKNTNIANVSKKFYSARDKCLKDNPFTTNHKLFSGFLTLLTDQKVGYSINEKLSLENGDIKDIEQYIDGFIDVLQDVATEASIKTRGVVQFYIDEIGNLRCKQIPSEQVIPIYNTNDKSELLYVIRFYSVSENVLSGKTKRIVEVYDDKTVQIFEEKTEGYLFVNSYNALENKVLYGDKVVENKALSWGRPPFAFFYNGQENRTDLDYVKSYIDVYDIISSDFANDICDFQDVFLIIKNYIGDSENIGEVIDEVRNAKGVAITGDDTGVDVKTIEIPVTARQTMLNILEKNIYKFGMGVNADDIEGNITNVRIKALYSNLDLKANKFETNIQRFWKECIYFINRYMEIGNKAKVEFGSLIFNRAMILNEVELLQTNATQIGVVSEKTRLANHTWVRNVDEEMADLINIGNMENTLDI